MFESVRGRIQGGKVIRLFVQAGENLSQIKIETFLSLYDDEEKKKKITIMSLLCNRYQKM
jgi:hypothetical protein